MVKQNSTTLDVRQGNNHYSVSYSGTQNYTNSSKVRIFDYQTETGTYTNGVLYNAYIVLNNEVVRNFIPCYRKSDGVRGLYDKVNNVFYTNSGTGTFAIGADVN